MPASANLRASGKRVRRAPGVGAKFLTLTSNSVLLGSCQRFDAAGRTEGLGASPEIGLGATGVNDDGASGVGRGAMGGDAFCTPGTSAKYGVEAGGSAREPNVEASSPLGAAAG